MDRPLKIGIKLLSTVAVAELFVHTCVKWLETTGLFPSKNLLTLIDALLLSGTVSVAVLFWVVRPAMLLDEYKKIKDRLSETSRTLQSLIAASPLAIIALDVKGHVLLWNPEAERMFGWTEEEVLGKYYPIVPEAKRQEFEELFGRAKGGEALANIEIARQRKDGLPIDISLSTAPIYSADGAVTGVISILADITARLEDRKALKTALAREENERARSEAIIAAIGDGISIVDADYKIVFQNAVQKKLIGEHVGEYCYRAYERKDHRCEGCPVAMSFEDGGIHTAERTALTDKGIVHVEITTSSLKDSAGKIIAGIEVVRDVTERRAAEQALKEREEQYRLLFDNSPNPMWLYDVKTLQFLTVNEAAIHHYGYSREEFLSMSIKDIRPEEDIPDFLDLISRSAIALRQSGLRRHRKKDGTVVWVEVVSHEVLFGKAGARLVVVNDVTERKKMEEEVFRISNDWEDTFNSITDMVTVHDIDWNIVRANKAAEKILGVDLKEVPKGNKCFRYYHGTEAPPDNCPSCACIQSGEPSVFEVFEPHLNMFVEIRAIPRFDKAHNLIGLIHIVRDITKRKRAEEYIQLQFRRMAALRSIDMAISSSLDLRVTLHILLEQVIEQLNVDAADVLLLDPHAIVLDYAAGRGFKTRAVERTHIRLGQGFAGRVAMDRTSIRIPDISKGGEALTVALEDENFKSYYAIPLIAKGQVKGVLEIFHRTPLDPDADWTGFLEMLGGQAAIAVDNLSLFETLQRSNLDLMIAYDRTIEGWSRALDLRDKETEGHSQRVTGLTLQIARAAGIPEDELTHIKRGALLHDIGKIGVPDAVLLKPGKLTDEEWSVMKKHPVIAYELLSSIPFLRLALDIPYCHHEKWDGTGYPRGLRGEQIPMSARIFAIVDVWDALLSDRPYRPAWPVEKVKAHVASLSGSHFDPAVVELFLATLDTPEHQPCDNS